MNATIVDVAEPRCDERFAFVKRLAADLSAGKIELPSFPDVVIRVRKALEKENGSSDELVQIICADPILAARVLNIANSAALKPSGERITDLNMAVNRIGRSMIRSTAIAFAITQLRSAQRLDSVREQLITLWQRSAHVAALCYVLTRKFTKLNADEAMFIGLMHGIGEMYIVVQADGHPDLAAERPEMAGIIEEWGPPIGSSILENWGFPDYVSEAVGQYHESDRHHDGDVDFTDVLILAHILHRFVSADENVDLPLEHISAWQRMNIEMTDLISVLKNSDEQIRSLRNALGN